MEQKNEMLKTYVMITNTKLNNKDLQHLKNKKIIYLPMLRTKNCKFTTDFSGII